MTLAVGIDLGGTGIFGALVDRGGRMVATQEERTPVAEGPDGVLLAMFGMVRALLTAAGDRRVAGIGLGIPGLLDLEAGLSLTSPNLHWSGVPVVQPFRQEFGLPVFMDNDARIGALAELHFGAGRSLRNFLFTALGTGVRSGIIVDRKVYRGAYGTAGEFGHIPIRDRGPRCNCGSRGCLEVLVSGPAVQRRTLDALSKGRDKGASVLRSLPQASISARTVAEAAQAGDGLANKIMVEVGYDLGLGVLAYYNLMGPEAVIVGGGVSLAGDLLLEPARRLARSRLMPGIREHLQVLQAELGDEGGAIGAATLVPGFIERPLSM